MAELIDVLRADPALAGLGEPDLAELVAVMRVSEVPAGGTLIEQGAAGDQLHLLLEGQAEISSWTPDAEQELGQAGPGSWLGLLALVDDAPRSATVTATSAVQVASLSREAYQQLSGARPALAVALQLALGAQLARDFRRLARRVRHELAQGQQVVADEVKEYDVVVIGGGPVGTCYAAWVKQRRPQTRIAIVEKRRGPGFKIGESLLAPALMSFLSIGVKMPVLRRLFNEKFGLHFWWTGTESTTLEAHINGSEFDETFQVERRMLEILLLNVARRAGIHVYQDTRVDLKKEDLVGPVKRLRCIGPGDRTSILETKVVCDATGPASVVARALKLYTKEVDSFQTNAYFAYFRKKVDPDVEGWDVTATRHICIPEGWLWFIELASWEKASEANLTRMVDHLLDHPDGRDEDYPSRFELAEKFDCPTEQWISIGVVPRADMDSARDLPLEERFQHYVDKYPGLKRIMDGYELVHDAYPGHRSYRSFVKMVHAAQRVSGDGWLAVGDAAFFLNPLFSPGMSAGTTVAHIGAIETIKALDSGDFSAEAFAGYERVAQGVYSSLLRENEVYYQSYKHPVSYERVWLMKFASQTPHLRRLQGLFDGLAREGGRLEDLAKAGPPPPFAYDDPIVRVPMLEIQALARADEAAGVDPAETAQKIKAIADAFIEGVRSAPGFDEFPVGRMMMDYDDRLERVEGKVYDPPLPTRRCPECQSTILVSLTRCPVCARPRDTP